MGKSVVNIETVFLAETIAASGSATSQEIKIDPAEGYFNLYVEMTGDGTCKLEASIKLGDSDFLVPVEHNNIVTAHIKTSGAGSDGKDFYSFTAGLAEAVKIVATETGGADSIVITKAILGWQ